MAKLTDLTGGRVVLAALCAAQFMLILDVVVIYVALPSIARDLGVAANQLHLVGVSYTVTFGSLLIVFGRIGDVLGRRRVLLVGLTLFVAASLVAGLAQETWQLFGARAAQGIGAAMVSANALAAINDRFEEGPARNAALGLWAMVGSAGAIAGQLLGGAITDLAGWRWTFWINVPVGILVLVVLATRLGESTAPRSQRIDVLGSLLLAFGLGTLALALVQMTEDRSTGSAVALLTAAATLLAVFAVLEGRTPHPVLRLGLLRLPGVRLANLTLFLNAGGLGATLFFVTLYLQNVLDYSPLAVAAVFAPVTLVILILSPQAARLTGRLGVRAVLTSGLALLATGMLVLARMPADGGLGDVLPGMLLLALGSSLTSAPTYIAASSGVPQGEQGAAAGLINSMQELGTAACLTLLALIASVPAATGGDPTGGYRAGTIGAAALLAVAALAALTTPRTLGRATPMAVEPAPANERAAKSQDA